MAIVKKLNAKYIVAVTLAVHVMLIAWGAYCHSPTADEPAYLASGVSHWRLGRFDLCKVSPPLVRLVAAAPIQIVGAKVDWSRYGGAPGNRHEHVVGHDFLAANGERSFGLFTLARWACIPFSLLGAWVVHRWAKELFGSLAGIAVLILWCFGPNILANAQLLTPDIGVSALCIATCYAFWRWSTSPTWWAVLLAGTVLGLAVLAKTNAVALYPSLLIAIALKSVVNKWLIAWRALIFQVIIAFMISVYVINFGYGFDGSFKSLGSYQFVSALLVDESGNNRFQNTVFEFVPVPLPSAFVEGIDLQRMDFENASGSQETYLRGKWYHHSWWWYYFYVVAVKVPIGTWVLTLIGGCAILSRRSPQWFDCLCFVVIPGAALFALPCSQSGFGHSLRYVLPAFPFAFVVASGAFSYQASRRQLRISVVALCWMLMSSLFVFPHTLSYFNELGGGPQHGHYHLLDGNFDWGQDYFYIRKWIAENPKAEPLYVAYWGYLPFPEMGVELKGTYLERPGLRSTEMRVGGTLPKGWYLISVNFLRSEFRDRRPKLEQFLSLTPEEQVTYTIYAYRLQ